MKVTITGRHVNVHEKFNDYVEKKVDRIEKFFHQVIDTKLILYKEKIDYFVEMLVFADGVQFHGIEKGGDFYSAFDLLLDKLEKQVKKHKEKSQTHKGIKLGEMPVVDISSEEESFVKITQIDSKPLNEIEAFLQMKLNNTEFMIFKKGEENGISVDANINAIIYKENDKLKMVELPSKMKNKLECFEVLDVKVENESSMNPNFKKKSSGENLKSMTINEALTSLTECDKCYLPFFNSETNNFNVLSTEGERIEVFIPTN